MEAVEAIEPREEEFAGHDVQAELEHAASEPQLFFLLVDVDFSSGACVACCMHT